MGIVGRGCSGRGNGVVDEVVVEIKVVLVVFLVL